jgi:hypothetical protein
MNYRFMGKQKTLALGVYPAVSLAAARKGRDKAREQLAAGKATHWKSPSNDTSPRSLSRPRWRR